MILFFFQDGVFESGWPRYMSAHVLSSMLPACGVALQHGVSGPSQETMLQTILHLHQKVHLPIKFSSNSGKHFLSVWFGYLSMLVVAWGGSYVPMLNRSLHPTLLPLGLAGLASTIRLVTVRLQSLTSSTIVACTI